MTHILEAFTHHDGFILADDTGFGKTLIAAMVANALCGPEDRVLILSPASRVRDWIAHLARAYPERAVHGLEVPRDESVLEFMTVPGGW